MAIGRCDQEGWARCQNAFEIVSLPPCAHRGKCRILFPKWHRPAPGTEAPVKSESSYSECRTRHPLRATHYHTTTLPTPPMYPATPALSSISSAARPHCHASLGNSKMKLDIQAPLAVGHQDAISRRAESVLESINSGFMDQAYRNGNSEQTSN